MHQFVELMIIKKNLDIYNKNLFLMMKIIELNQLINRLKQERNNNNNNVDMNNFSGFT